MPDHLDPTLLFSRDELKAIAAALDQALLIHDLAPEDRKLEVNAWTHLVTALRKTRRADLALDRVGQAGPYRTREPKDPQRAARRRRERALRRRKERDAEANRRANRLQSHLLRPPRPERPPDNPNDLPR